MTKLERLLQQKNIFQFLRKLNKGEISYESLLAPSEGTGQSTAFPSKRHSEKHDNSARTSIEEQKDPEREEGIRFGSSKDF